MSITGRDGKPYVVTPTLWPDTTITALTNTLKETHARLQESINKRPPHERMRYLVQTAADRTAPSYLRHHQLSARTLKTTTSWDIERQRRKGVWGANLRDLDTALFDEPADQQDILRVFLAANWIMKTCCGTTVVSRTAEIQSLLSESDLDEEEQEI